MEVEPGEGWADAVSKILRMGTNNPESNRILTKAKKDQHSDDSDGSEGEPDSDDDKSTNLEKIKAPSQTARLKPDAQVDALVENDLKDAATRGVVHLFNAVKTVNPKSDKKKKKKKKKKKTMKKRKFKR